MTEAVEYAEALAAAIQTGDVAGVQAVLAAHPGSESRPLGGRFKTRTPLSVVTDWPGYFPRGPETVAVLIAAGADPNEGEPGDERPLHGAASTDDTDVAVALIDGGADVDCPDGSIGTPIENAVGYGCWNVARLLVDRGAAVDSAWVAAALGLIGRLDEILGADPDPDVVSQAFWHACAGAQRRAAEHLLGRGASLDWVPPYAHGTALDAAGGSGTQRENVVTWLKALGVQAAL